MSDIKRPMSILIIEDNEIEVNNFNECIKLKNDVKLVKATNSSITAIEYVKSYMPEGIILDLELHNGEGSGLMFLKELQKLKLDSKPLIIVTTNVASTIIYNLVRKLGVDFIFYKKQNDYSAEMVINSMISIRDIVSNENNKRKQEGQTSIEDEEKIKQMIKNEMDLIGIPNHLKRQQIPRRSNFLSDRQ